MDWMRIVDDIVIVICSVIVLALGFLFVHKYDRVIDISQTMEVVSVTTEDLKAPNSLQDEIVISDIVQYDSVIERTELVLADVDLMGLVPAKEISDGEKIAINRYINDTMEQNSFTDCLLIEYTRDNEYNGNCYHFVFDDKYYKCIYLSDGKPTPLLLYDVELTDRVTINWQYV